MPDREKDMSAMNENDILKDNYMKSLKGLFKKKKNRKVLSVDSKLEEYRARSILKSMSFFYDLMSQEKAPGTGEGKPAIGYFCNVVPDEMILALGGIPVRLCSADFDCFKEGEEIIPGDVCPVVKSICGAVNYGKFDDIDLLIIPATCDGKMKLREILSPVFPEKIYLLDIPRESNYLKNVEIWVEKYRQLFEFLNEKFNSSITRKTLLQACRMTNKRTEVFRKIYDFRAQNPGVINAFDYFVMANASFLVPPSLWSENAEKVYSESVRKINNVVENSSRAKRILLAGAPVIFPNFKIIEILEEVECDVSADAMCSAYGRLYDPVEIDEETESGIIRSLTLKYIAPSMCPCFIGMNKFLDFIIDTVKENNLDGVIYHNLRLCQVFDMQSVLLRQILKEEKIPFLSIKTDFGKEDRGQLKTRVEAFLEMLKCCN